MKSIEIKIECDAQPIILFTEILNGFLQRRQTSFNFDNLGFELTRIDCDHSAALAGKVIVRLYPSDAFLSFAGAIFARDFDFGAIKQV